MNIHHLQISHNALPSLPHPPQKKCISIVFNFSWDCCNLTKEKWKTKVLQDLRGGQIRCIIGDVQVAFCTWLRVIRSDVVIFPDFYFSSPGHFSGSLGTRRNKFPERSRTSEPACRLKSWNFNSFMISRLKLHFALRVMRF